MIGVIGAGAIGEVFVAGLIRGGTAPGSRRMLTPTTLYPAATP